MSTDFSVNACHAKPLQQMTDVIVVFLVRTVFPSSCPIIAFVYMHTRFQTHILFQCYAGIHFLFKLHSWCFCSTPSLSPFCKFCKTVIFNWILLTVIDQNRLRLWQRMEQAAYSVCTMHRAGCVPCIDFLLAVNTNRKQTVFINNSFKKCSRSNVEIFFIQSWFTKCLTSHHPSLGVTEPSNPIMILSPVTN